MVTKIRIAIVKHEGKYRLDVGDGNTTALVPLDMDHSLGYGGPVSDLLDTAVSVMYFDPSPPCRKCFGRGWTILEVKDHKYALVSACPECNPQGKGT